MGVLASLKGSGVVRNGACGGVWSMMGGIPPATPFAAVSARVGVVAASREGAGGALRACRGMALRISLVDWMMSFLDFWKAIDDPAEQTAKVTALVPCKRGISRWSVSADCGLRGRKDRTSVGDGVRELAFVLRDEVNWTVQNVKTSKIVI